MAPMPTKMKCVLALPMGGRAVGLDFCRQRLTTAGGEARGLRCLRVPLFAGNVVHFDRCVQPTKGNTPQMVRTALGLMQFTFWHTDLAGQLCRPLRDDVHAIPAATTEFAVDAAVRAADAVARLLCSRRWSLNPRRTYYLTCDVG